MTFKIEKPEVRSTFLNISDMSQGKVYRNDEGTVVMKTDEHGTVMILTPDTGYLTDVSYFDDDIWYPVTLTATLTEGEIA